MGGHAYGAPTMDGWTQDLPLLPGYYWVRTKGHHRSIRVEGVPMVLHEEPPFWMPLT
ncbi:MAG: hypothetical protein V3T86_17220 [Planctomycetota bacterium]